MNNQRFDAPQHELNVISSMLRDGSTASQLAYWGNGRPHYWLASSHFQSAWLGDLYDVLLSGGLNDINQRLRTYPQANPPHAAADVVVGRMQTQLHQRALAGDQSAWETLNNSDYWARLHGAVVELAQPSWPSHPSDARHDAYVIVRADRHPSATPDIPFELSRGRSRTEETVNRELAVIGAVLNDPNRAWLFHYSPSSPDASPFWLQPSDFSDPATAEIWDALVTGPDPAIALPALEDPQLTSEQRTQVMIEHIYRRLSYNDYHRSTADPAAQQRLDNNTNQAIASALAQASRPDFSPNPDNAAVYAVNFILEPSIPATIQTLAGDVRRDGAADGSLYQVAMDLDSHEHALNELAERLDAAPRTLAGYGTQQPVPEPSDQPADAPSYAARDVERRVLISLMRQPEQLGAGGYVGRLAEQDFTQREHAYLFKAVQSLPPDAARDPWVLANQAHQLARYDRVSPLDNAEMYNIAYAATTLPAAAPAESGAGHLMVMTVRRTARNAGTAMEAAAGQASADPRHLIDYSRAQVQQATREALRHHEQSVPNPARYATTQQATVA